MEYEHYCIIYGFQCLHKQDITSYFISESRQNINRNKLVSLKLEHFKNLLSAKIETILQVFAL